MLAMATDDGARIGLEAALAAIRHRGVPHQHAGSTALAKMLGLTPQQVSKWRRKGMIPIGWVPAVEKATGVPRHVLRPDRTDLFPPPKA